MIKEINIDMRMAELKPKVLYNFIIKRQPTEQKMGQWNEYIPKEILPKNSSGFISKDC